MRPDELIESNREMAAAAIGQGAHELLLEQFGVSPDAPDLYRFLLSAVACGMVDTVGHRVTVDLLRTLALVVEDDAAQCGAAVH